MQNIDGSISSLNGAIPKTIKPTSRASLSASRSDAEQARLGRHSTQIRDNLTVVFNGRRGQQMDKGSLNQLLSQYDCTPQRNLQPAVIRGQDTAQLIARECNLNCVNACR